MRRFLRISAVFVVPLSMVLLTGVGPAAGNVRPEVTEASHFVYTAGAAETDGDLVYIDNTATNGKPDALLFVTPQYTPDGLCGCVAEPYALGVSYFPSPYDEWVVFREDLDDLPVGESFDVLAVPSTSASAFVQTATSSNVTGNATLIDSPLTNHKPDAVIQVTQDFSPGGFGGTVNPHTVGVVYDTAAKEWGIFNEDGAAMTIGASFNVLVGSAESGGGKTKLVKATDADESGAHNSVFFSNKKTNDNPDNVTFDTQVYNPDGKGAALNNTETGVWYDGSNSKEAVFNENDTLPPVGEGFNLLIFPS
ncbi:MAG TPA: hypothetical protein VEJ87_01895 [Acidimicrobiales bacterium]|nr:hypothetical protein [Acidimicrobiales bacterium]